MESPKPEKTKKQIAAARRFRKFYDTKLKGQDVKRTCDCGCVVSYMSLSRHKKSYKHERLMREKYEEKELSDPIV